MTDTARDEEAWLAWRAAGLTASDMAAAYARSYGKTPRSVVAAKLGKIPEEQFSDDMQTRFAYGHFMEGPIAGAVEQLSPGLAGLNVVYCDGAQSWVTHGALEWPRATVDGFLLADPADELFDAVALFEAKTTTAKSANWKVYEAQTQWQMFVTGVGRALIACFMYGRQSERDWTLRLRLVEADPAMQHKMLELGTAMWSHIQDGTLPGREEL